MWIVNYDVQAPTKASHNYMGSPALKETRVYFIGSNVFSCVKIDITGTLVETLLHLTLLSVDWLRLFFFFIFKLKVGNVSMQFKV